MNKVKNIIEMMSNLREEIINAKKTLKIQLDNFDYNINKAREEGNVNLVKELQSEKSMLLKEFNYLRYMDDGNTLTYDTLGYLIKGYEMMSNNFKKGAMI